MALFACGSQAVHPLHGWSDFRRYINKTSSSTMILSSCLFLHRERFCNTERRLRALPQLSLPKDVICISPSLLLKQSIAGTAVVDVNDFLDVLSCGSAAANIINTSVKMFVFLVTIIFWVSPADWFPLPDAVKEAFGLPPICPPTQSR